MLIIATATLCERHTAERSDACRVGLLAFAVLVTALYCFWRRSTAALGPTSSTPSACSPRLGSPFRTDESMRFSDPSATSAALPRCPWLAPTTRGSTLESVPTSTLTPDRPLSRRWSHTEIWSTDKDD